MNFQETLTTLARHIGESSLQASLLLPLVLVLQTSLRRWLTPGWRHALWIPVLFRLLFPVFPESGSSVFNWLPKPAAKTFELVSPVRERPPHPDHRSTTGQLPVTQANIVDHSPQKTRPDIGGNADAPPTSFQLTTAGCAQAWFAGAVLCGGLMLALHLRQRRRVRQLRPATDPRVVRQWREACDLVGISRPVALLETDADHSPALFGLTRVRLLIPHGLQERFSDAQLRHIFLHECAHLKRRDLPLNWLLAALQCLHWFNPLLWWAWSRARADREYACDAHALRLSQGEPADYGETLIRLVEQTMSPFGQPGAVGIAERASDLGERIRMIANFSRSRRWARFGGALLLALCCTTLTDARSAKSPAGEPPPPRAATTPSAAGHLSLRALDSVTGQAIAGVTFNIRFRFLSPPSGDAVLRLVSKADGRCDVPVPENTIALMFVNCEKPGFAPLHYVGRPNFHPAEVGFEMRAAVRGSGRILGANGNPVANAKVRFSLYLPREADTDGPTTDIMTRVFETDETGRWTCDVFSDDPQATYRISFVHPTHAHLAPNERTGRKLPLAILKTGDHVTHATRGGWLRGHITDTHGAPIPNAAVTLHRNTVPINKETRTSQPDGFYYFETAVGPASSIMVTADGFSPKQLRTIGYENMKALNVTLETAAILRGRVIDPQGAPISGANIALSMIGKSPVWVESICLSDERGEFVYRNAPTGAASYRIHKHGFSPILHQPLDAGSEHNTVTLQTYSQTNGRPPLRNVSFAGNVLDSATGKPLTTFTVTPGVRSGPGDQAGATEWITGHAQRVLNGKYSGMIRFTRKGDDYSGKFRFVVPPELASNPIRLRITAEGHQPLESDWMTPTLHPKFENFRLEQAPD